MSHRRRPFVLSELLDAVDATVVGELDPCQVIGWIERDSRQIQAGDCYIALAGDRFDGHAFVTDAAAAGAVAAIIAAGSDLASAPHPPCPLIVVDDPLRALQRFAAARRDTMPSLSVIGVTGSVGKTTVKETIATAIGDLRRAYRSPGNMNSEIGLPLSILEMPPDTEIAVLEMGGAYAFGELALLAEIARPRIGVVTSVHPVHLERMGTIEAIAETKAELVDAVPPDGVAILNADDRFCRQMIPRSHGQVLTFGIENEADFRAFDIVSAGLDGVSFRMQTPDGDCSVRLPVPGVHMVDAALIAAAAGHALGLPLQDLVANLETGSTQVRIVVHEGPAGSRIIDDTYNASPPSVLSALQLVQETPAARRWAVLGDMRELGDLSEDAHRSIGRAAARIVDHLVTFGELGQIIAKAAREEAGVDARVTSVQSFGLEQRRELVDHLRSALRSGDLVLIKGSRGLTMETIVEDLRAQIASSQPVT